MDYYIGFNDLKVGQRVKIKGKPEEEGKFKSLEISIKTPKDQSEVEGLIQGIDHDSKAVRVANTDFTLPDSIDILDWDGNTVDFDGLKVGEMVKLKGKYRESEGFLPEIVKMKETIGFEVEELQGIIDKIDSENKTLRVVGYTVEVDAKTTIEGF